MIAHRRGEVKPKHLRACGAPNFYFINHQSQIINHKSSLPRFSVDRGGGFRYNVMIIGGRSESERHGQFLDTFFGMKLKKISLPHNAKKQSRKRGFALIATLTLMMLLAMIATALMATAASQNRIALQSVLQAEARQQALVGLDAAIGELQTELGPDQRVTASSGVISESEGGNQQHVLGVWNSWDGPIYGSGLTGTTKGRIQGTYTQGRANMFRKWLISSRDTRATHGLKSVNELSSRQPGRRICMVGEGTLGKSLNARHWVYADLLSMPSTGKNKACFAWWVGGENQKAKISVKDPEKTDDPMEVLHRTWNTPAPMVVDNTHLDFLPATIEDPAKLLTINSLPLVGSSSQSGGAPYFYDITTSSFSLPVNVSTGGLKQDLCLLLNKESLKGTDFAARTDQDCPIVDNKEVPVGTVNKMPIGSWQNLYAYYNCWPDGSANAGDHFTARLIGDVKNAYTRMSGSAFPDMKDTYYDNPHQTGGLTTYFDSRATQDQGSKYSGYARTPVMLAFMSNFGLWTEPTSSSTSDGEQLYKLQMFFAPIVLWWNPYNVPMRISANKLWSYGSPYKTTWLQAFSTEPQKVSGSYRNAASWTRSWNTRALKNPNSDGDMSVGFSPDGGNYFNASDKGTEELVFQPGEVMFFSPANPITVASGNYLKPLNPWIPGYRPSSVAGYKATLYNEMVVGQDKLASNTPGATSLSNIASGKFSLGLRFGINAGGGSYGPDGKWYAPGKDECLSLTNGFNGIGQYPYNYAQSPQRMLLGWYNPDEFSNDDNRPVICDSNSGDTIWSIDDNDDKALHYVASVGVVAKSGNPAVDTRMFVGADYRTKLWQHSSPAMWGGMICNPTEQQRQYHPYQLAVLPVGTGLDSPVDNIGNNGYIGITSDGEQVSYAAVSELPVHPPFSLAGLAGMRLQPGWYDSGNNGEHPNENRLRRMQYQAGVPGVGIGNSFADPCLPAGDVYQFHDISPADSVGINDKLFSDFFDHGLLINDAMWDRWFMSSVSDMPDGKGTRKAREVWQDFVSGKEALPVARYKKTVTPYKDEQVIERIMSQDGWKYIAQYLMVDGGFNVNSTSVEAWAAVLQGLARRNLVSGDGKNLKLVESGKSEQQVLFSRFMLSTTDKSTDSTGGYSMSQGSSSFRNSGMLSAWSEVRMLEPESIRKLAEEMVKQVRKRGPFLSMSDFINRRLDPAGGEAAMKGALQAAIDATDINRDFQDIIVKPQGGNYYSFPEAENGSMYTAAPGYLIQSDVLTALGNILTVRDDTFTVRAYGCVKNPSNAILAQAWCEAVVQRTMDYVDPSNDPADVDYNPDGSKGKGLTKINKVLGRQFRVVSFKWLDLWDI